MGSVVVEPVEVVTDVERRARILEAAALEIEVRGWSTYELEDGAGAMCLVGALATAQGIPLCELRGNDSRWDDATAAWNGPASGLTTNRLFCWNDSRDTAEEVTFLLRWRAEEIRDGR